MARSGRVSSGVHSAQESSRCVQSLSLWVGQCTYNCPYSRAADSLAKLFFDDEAIESDNDGSVNHTSDIEFPEVLEEDSTPYVYWISSFLNAVLPVYLCPDLRPLWRVWRRARPRLWTGNRPITTIPRKMYLSRMANSKMAQPSPIKSRNLPSPSCLALIRVGRKGNPSRWNTWRIILATVFGQSLFVALLVSSLYLPSS